MSLDKYDGLSWCDLLERRKIALAALEFLEFFKRMIPWDFVARSRFASGMIKWLEYISLAALTTLQITDVRELALSGAAFLIVAAIVGWRSKTTWFFGNKGVKQE